MNELKKSPSFSLLGIFIKIQLNGVFLNHLLGGVTDGIGGGFFAG